MQSVTRLSLCVFHMYIILVHQKLQGVCAEIRVASPCGDLIAKVYSCAWKTATRDKARAGDDKGKA